MSVSGAPVNAKRIGDESCLTVPEAEAAAIYCMQQLGVSILGHQTVLLEKNNFSFIYDHGEPIPVRFFPLNDRLSSNLRS